MAFQKYMGFDDPSGRVDEQTAQALSVETVRPHARANSGTLVEIDKSKQVLFFVIDGVTEWVLNVSTGNGQEYTEADQNTPGETISGVSLTPSGLHEVNRQRVEGWWEGDLGTHLPTEVLRRWRRRARVEQHPELPRVARLRPGERSRHGLDLGLGHHAARYLRLGPRRRLTGPACPSRCVTPRRSLPWGNSGSCVLATRKSDPGQET